MPDCSKKSRVLFLAPQPFFLNRGTPLNVRAMLEALPEHQYHVDALVLPGGELIEIPGVTLHPTWKIPGLGNIPIGPSKTKLAYDVVLFIQAAYLLLRHRYDALHGVEEGGVMAWLLTRVFRVPYVFDMDSCMVQQIRDSGFFRNSLALRLVESFERAAISEADIVLTVCGALTEKARRYDAAAKIFQIEDFPVESAESVDTQLSVDFRKDVRAEERALLVYTGNLERYQGIDLALEAFASLSKSIRDRSQLVFVGGGAPNSPMIEAYRARAAALGIAGSTLFTGNRAISEMGSIMAAADILLSPRAEGENTPLKLYSYMAAARPIVATRILSHTQVLSNTEAYLGDPEPISFAAALAEALEDFFAGREHFFEKAKQARMLIDTKYNRAEFSRRVQELYQDLLHSSDNGGTQPARVAAA